MRWVEWVQPGEGQPLFNFYYPGLSYLVSVVHLVVPSLASSLKLAVALLWMVGALFTFAFLRPFGALPAAMSAALFALTPYIILDVFVRAAYAEFAAIMLAPGVLWASDRILRDGRVTFVPVAALVGGLMLVTHLPSVLLFVPVFAGYAARIIITRQTSAGRLVLLATAGVLAGGAAAFYIAPAVQELPLVAMSRMTSGYFDYRRHFLEPRQWVAGPWGYGASVEGPDDGMSFQLGILQCAVIVVSAIYLLRAIARRRVRTALDVGFWLGIVCLSLFVTSAASELVWRVVGPLTYLQFPWRALMLVPISCAVLAARVVSAIPSRDTQAVVVIAVVSLQYHLSHTYLRPAGYMEMRRMNIDDPAWAASPGVRESAFLDRGFTPLVAEEETAPGLGRWSARSAGGAEVHEVAVADHRLVLDVRSSAGVDLQIHSHAFPGWRVLVRGEPVDVRIERPYGFMEVSIPPGEHVVEARFENTPLRRTANRVSAASIGICLGWWMWFVCARRGRPGGHLTARACRWQ